VVIEAALRSGTTSTANAAHALNRPVLAVPGSVESPLSAGCHQLIREQQAVIATDWRDIPELLGGEDVISVVGTDPVSRPTDGLTSTQRLVLDAVPLRAWATLEELIYASGLSARELLASLGVLCAEGFVTQEGNSWRAARV
jgi:DNA processing protein